MSVVYILVFAAILMAGGFLVAFIWSVKSGQYDDTYTPSVRILFDDAVRESGEPGEGKKSEDGSQETEGGKSRSVQSQLAGRPETEVRRREKRSVEK